MGVCGGAGAEGLAEYGGYIQFNPAAKYIIYLIFFRVFVKHLPFIMWSYRTFVLHSLHTSGMYVVNGRNFDVICNIRIGK